MRPGVARPGRGRRGRPRSAAERSARRRRRGRAGRPGSSPTVGARSRWRARRAMLERAVGGRVRARASDGPQVASAQASPWPNGNRRRARWPRRVRWRQAGRGGRGSATTWPPGSPPAAGPQGRPPGEHLGHRASRPPPPGGSRKPARQPLGLPAQVDVLPTSSTAMTGVPVPSSALSSSSGGRGGAGRRRRSPRRTCRCRRARRGRRARRRTRRPRSPPPRRRHRGLGRRGSSE